METSIEKTKILVISPQLPSNPNGGARVLQDRLKPLARGADLFMVVKHPTNTPARLDYLKTVHVIKKTKPSNFILFFYRYFILTGLAMYRVILKEKIKVVQIEFYDGLVYSLFLLPLRIFGVKLFYTAHDIQCLYFERGSFRFRLVKFFEKVCFRYFVDMVFVWGKDDLRELLSWNLSSKKLKIIHPIIKTEDNKGWALNPASMNFVFMGSINHAPNRDALKYILENLWSEIKKISPKSKLYLILGSANKLEFSDSSIVNCGFVEDPTEIMRKCNLFLAPIVSGTGIKIKVIESFGFGMPIISTPLGFRNFDNLDDGKIFLANSTEEFLLKIKAVISQPELLLEISDYEKEYYRKNFSEQNVDNYMEYYLATNTRA